MMALPVLFVLTCTFPGGADGGEETDDPFTWSVGATEPPFTKLLDDAAYTRRLDYWHQQIDLVALRASTKPSAGLVAVGVHPDTPAESLGMKVGDVMITLNKRPLVFLSDYVVNRGEKGGPLEIWSPEAGLRTITVPPRATLGLRFQYDGPVWFPEFGYLRSEKHPESWDGEAVAACLAFRQDPDFAVTALSKVRAAGYHGSYLAAVHLCANAYRGLYREALSGGKAAIAALPATDRGEPIKALVAAAMRSFQLPLAKALLGEYRDTQIDATGFEPYLADHRVATSDRRGWIPSLPRPAGEQRFDLAGVATGVMGDGSDQTALTRNMLSGKGGLNMKTGKGRSARFRIDVPPVETLDLTVDVTLSGTASESLTDAFGVGIGPSTLEPVSQMALMPFSTSFTIRHSGVVTLPGLPRVWSPMPFDERDPQHYNLHLLVEHGQVTGEVNGRPLCHVPMRTLGQPWSIHLAGVYINALVSVRAAALGTKPPEGWAPPAAAPPQPPEPPAKATPANDF